MSNKCTISGNPPMEGLEDSGAPQPLGENGQYKDYYILCDEDRKKGYVRPLRRSYRHVGLEPPKNLRDLDDEEHARYDQFGYVKYEEWNDDRGIGRFWTQAQLTPGCKTITTMGEKLAETWAVDPKFYGSTFCCACGKHYPVGEFIWEDGERLGS